MKPSASNNAKPTVAKPTVIPTVVKTAKGPTLQQLQARQGDMGLTPKQRVAQGQAADRGAGRPQRPNLADQKDIASTTRNSMKSGGGKFVK